MREGDKAGAREPTAEQLVYVEELKKDYPSGHGRRRAVVQAVRGVTFGIRAGETLALVGETGCGKTTVARVIAGLIPPTSGRVLFRGVPVVERRHAARSTGVVQMVFQNPRDSLNPRMTVGRIVEEPLRLRSQLSQTERSVRVRELLELVGFGVSVAREYPFELTAGEQQRVSIARALASDPVLLILDEPTSLLDSVQRDQILALLAELQAQVDMAYLCITHDLRVVARLSHRIAVMYLGKMVEEGPAGTILGSPRHPYTIALMGSILTARPDRRVRPVVLQGEVPSAINPPLGCPLHPRCPFAAAGCDAPQALRPIGTNGHMAACHRVADVRAAIGDPSPDGRANVAEMKITTMAETSGAEENECQ